MKYERGWRNTLLGEDEMKTEIAITDAEDA